MKTRNAARRRSAAGLRASAPLVAPDRGPGAWLAPLAPSRERGPRCPRCDMQTERRLRARDGNPFWGCPRFPYCRGTVDVGERAPEAVVTATTGSPLESIGKKRYRVFVAELVRRTRAGESYDQIVLGAMRAAFPKSRCIGNDALRERGLALAIKPQIYDAVCALLDAQP